MNEKKNSNTNSNEQIEEYKKLLISKDNEISKLNDINLSKENEIKRLNKLIEDMKSGSAIQEMEENFKKEKEKLLTKINNLELKIYNINDEKKKLGTKNKKLNEKLNKNDDKKNKEITEEKNMDKDINDLGNKNDEFNIKYEELLKMKEDIEEQNKKLIEEIKSLKSLKNKDKSENDNNDNDNDNENDNENFNDNDIDNLNENNNQNSKNINNDELINQIEELKKIIDDYKTGKIIPDIINTDKISDKELKKKFDTLIQKNKNYESKIKTLNDNITYNKKNKKDLENIIFKQENKINELNLLLKKKDNIIKVKDSSINKNEGYSLQLMNIIKEQKLQIQNIKKQKNEDDISQIAELKRQINNLENVIELKENTISSMKKTHKNLQDKYMKMNYNKKKQEQENFLNQAKLLKKQKLARDAKKNQNKYISKLNISNNLPQFTEESNKYSEIEYPNLNTNSNINNFNNSENEKKEINHKNMNDIVLPVIPNNNSVKIEENINNIKDNLINDEDNNLDEINNMMEKVIEENN